MQTLYEQGLGVKAIVKAYPPEKQWKLPMHWQDWVSSALASWQQTTAECSYGRDRQQCERADVLTNSPQHLPNCRQTVHQPVLCDARSKEWPAPQIMSLSAGTDCQRWCAAGVLHDTAVLTEHSYNETGLLHRGGDLLPKPACQQAEQPRLVSGKKADVRRTVCWLNVMNLMMLAGVCWGVKSKLMLLEERVQSQRRLLCWLSAAWTDRRLKASPAHRLHLPARRRPAHMVRITQNWLQANWPATALLIWSCGSSSEVVSRATFNLSIVSGFGYSLWYFFLHGAPDVIVCLNLESLGVNDLFEWTQNFAKHLTACATASVGHLEHLQ